MKHEFEYRMEFSKGIRSLLASCAVCVLAAGCTSTSSSTNTDTTESGEISSSGTITASNLTEKQAISAVQTWGSAYSKNEKDKTAAINYASALRAAGQTGQAVDVLRKTVIHHSSDREALAEYGKALAANGNFDLALDAIRRAQRTDNPDWRLLAAEGGVLDSLKRNDEARVRYRQALVLAPDEPQILNNYGMSFLLTGELDEAEAILKKAVNRPNATIRSRQNLALVLGLKGNFKEAEVVATKDLPPEQAKANIAFLREMLSSQNTWSDIKNSG
jgi:Flp pilus assembly protein TadD